MREVELEGAEVARALENASTSDAVADALVGCCFYLEDPDALAEITGVERPGPIFTLKGPSGPKRLTVAQIARGYIVEQRDELRLPSLVHAAKPPHVIAGEEARRRLAKAGIREAKLSADDALELDLLLPDGANGPVPSWNARLRISGILHRYELYRDYIRLASSWPGALPGTGEPLLGDVLIQLAFSYRAIGDEAGAMRLTDAVVRPETAAMLNRSDQAVLFTQRAALHLDLFDRDRDPMRLKSAKKCADAAWQRQQSEACSLVYKRLKKIEGELRDEVTAVSDRKREARVRAADAEWTVSRGKARVS